MRGQALALFALMLIMPAAMLLGMVVLMPNLDELDEFDRALAAEEEEGEADGDA